MEISKRRIENHSGFHLLFNINPFCKYSIIVKFADFFFYFVISNCTVRDSYVYV